MDNTKKIKEHISVAVNNDDYDGCLYVIVSHQQRKLDTKSICIKRGIDKPKDTLFPYV